MPGFALTLQSPTPTLQQGMRLIRTAKDHGEGEPMTRFACVLALCSMMGSGVSAQTMETTISGNQDGIAIEGPGEGKRADEPSSAYEKKVGGLVWLEATVGPSRFDVTRFRNLDFIPEEIARQIPSLVVSGPEFGGALKFRAGSVTVGGHFKKADYEPFDLITAGLTLGFLVRAVPYVHPVIKLGLNYYTTKGGLEIPGVTEQVSNVRTDGGGASMGLGLRIPIVKWVSIAADFDYSIIGLAIRGDVRAFGQTESFTGGTAGTAIAGTFALTIHLGG